MINYLIGFVLGAVFVYGIYEFKYIKEYIITLIDIIKWLNPIHFLAYYDFNSYHIGRIQCKIFGHPWEWMKIHTISNLNSLGAYCRRCMKCVNGYPKMLAFIRHEGDHKYNCEINGGVYSTNWVEPLDKNKE